MAVVATEQAEVRSSSPACAVPDGTAHAVDDGAPATHCGIPVGRLTVWAELSWPPAGMAALDVCPRCDPASSGRC